MVDTELTEQITAIYKDFSDKAIIYETGQTNDRIML